MDMLSYSNMCRTCLSQNRSIRPIFSTKLIMEEEITLCDLLHVCSTVNISRDDGLPTNMCLQCIEEVRRAFAFRKMCENSENTLRSCFPQSVQSTKLETHETCEINNMKICFDESKELEKPNWAVENVLHVECEDSDSMQSNNAAFGRFLNEEESELININKPGNIRSKKSYNCAECQEECLGLASYWKHMANFHGKNFKCEICGKKFKTQSLLVQHQNTHNKMDLTKLRGRKTRKKTRIIKQRNLPRTCDICNKTFRFHSNLVRHKRTHTGEKPFLCNVCGKGFGQLSYLKIHSFIHTGEKPYKCQMCERSFAAPGTLMTHVRIHTGERPHACKICGKDFPQSGYLATHMRTHTGEKPIVCKVCNRRFNQSGRLVVHMRIHSGEKPYPCEECGRSFAARGTLKKHIRTHTGERPYVCSVCGQTFAQSGTLATHMKVHRKKV